MMQTRSSLPVLCGLGILVPIPSSVPDLCPQRGPGLSKAPTYNGLSLFQTLTPF